MAWTKEQAREMAKRGGKAKAEKARREKKSPSQRARDALEAESLELARELLKAAKGEGVFEALEAKERLAAVQKALEWGIGRPGMKKPDAESDGRSKQPVVGLEVE